MEGATLLFFWIPIFVNACLFWWRLGRWLLSLGNGGSVKPFMGAAARKLAEFSERP